MGIRWCLLEHSCTFFFFFLVSSEVGDTSCKFLSRQENTEFWNHGGARWSLSLWVCRTPTRGFMLTSRTLTHHQQQLQRCSQTSEENSWFEVRWNHRWRTSADEQWPRVSRLFSLCDGAQSSSMWSTYEYTYSTYYNGAAEAHWRLYCKPFPLVFFYSITY